MTSSREVGHWFQGTNPMILIGCVHTPATETYVGEQRLTVGGRHIELIEVGPTHTHAEAMVYIPDAQIYGRYSLYRIDAGDVGGAA